MKFTAFVSLALVGAASAAAIPNVANVGATVNGAVSNVEGTAMGLLSPVSHEVEKTATNLKRKVGNQLEYAGQSVTNLKRKVGNQLEYAGQSAPNSGNGPASGVVGTVQDADNIVTNVKRGGLTAPLAGVANTVSGVTGGLTGGQLGGLELTVEQTLGSLTSLSSNPTALLSSLTQLQHAVNVGKLTKGDISNFPAAVQGVIGQLSTTA